MKTLQPVLILFLISLAGFSEAQTYLKLEVKAPTAEHVKFSADGKYLAIAEGNDIIFYSSGTNTEVRTLEGHKKTVLSVDFDAGNQHIVSGGRDASVILWDPSNGSMVKTFSGHVKSVNEVKFSSNNHRIASVSDDLSLRVWGVESGKMLYSKENHLKPVKALAIGPDDNLVVTAGADRKIIIRNFQSGDVIKEFQGHDGIIRSLDFSPGGKLLASGGEDKKLRLWDVETGELVREFSDHKGWIVDVEFSGDGKYIAACSDNKEIYFYETSTGDLALRIDEPKYTLKNIAISPDGKELASVEVYSKTLKIYDISSLNISPIFRFKDENDRTSPQIFVSTPPNTQTGRVRFSKDLIDIKGTVIDESGVRQVRVNGMETPIRDNGNFVIKLPLTMGDNFVNIEATDVNDNIALKKFVVTRRDLDGGEYDATSAKNYLFIVGINKYEYWPQLNNAVRDANEVANTLIGSYNFDFSNVTVLLDEQATRNNIYKTLRSFIERITPQDNFLVYFSGHGHFDELLNEGYWIPYEAHLNTDGEYLPNSSILKVLENIESQHTFLVADACFSGSLFAEPTRGYADNVEKYKSRWGLASGRLETVSDGAYGENSPFADSFIEFLKNNDKDKVSVSELVQHVKMEVADKVDQTPIGNPLKSLGDEGGEFIFYKK